MKEIGKDYEGTVIKTLQNLYPTIHEADVYERDEQKRFACIFLQFVCLYICISVNCMCVYLYTCTFVFLFGVDHQPA